jgi:hypothetical protein
MITKFDDIRPYTDAEIPAAMKRIAHSEYLKPICDFGFPEKDLNEIREIILNITTIEEFQLKIMFCINEQIIKSTIDRFSYNGMENLDPKKKYLFISNHRDIVLDSSLLQQIFLLHGFPTSEITFGSNLMSSQLVIDIGKSNKMFKVNRGESARKFYENSLYLSEYMYSVITEKGESIWIAQRNGRTKDGIDKTYQGLVKMLALYGRRNIREHFSKLNITPVAVSYQYEPCDYLKVRELYLKQQFGAYQKTSGEDLHSIIHGIKQYKGNFCLRISPPITMDTLKTLPDNDANFCTSLTHIIDRQIISSYQLWDTNYMAYDMLLHDREYAEYYNQERLHEFKQYIENQIAKIEDIKDTETLRKMFLELYANPVKEKHLGS